ncbi:unnamed protein product [Rangifer tarandus platyrhynchus]|uniref:Uncharacterized protein n=2 Tax=Rangifer tarandus platyrhynchus TaxID=3082113 RepID=A0AC60A712_RANTA|nr:unnamed protein product [Rangifer tarandus platyrhynchus]
MIKNLPALQETQVQSLGQEDPLEKGMATYSSILAWRIPWTEEPVSPWDEKACSATISSVIFNTYFIIVIFISGVGCCSSILATPETHAEEEAILTLHSLSMWTMNERLDRR